MESTRFSQNLRVSPTIPLFWQIARPLERSRGFALKKSATALMIFLFVASEKVCAQSPTQPTLPQKTVSLTLPTQGTSTCPTLTTALTVFATYRPRMPRVFKMLSMRQLAVTQLFLL